MKPGLIFTCLCLLISAIPFGGCEIVHFGPRNAGHPPPPIKPDYNDLNYRVREGDVLSIRCIEDNTVDKQDTISAMGEIDLVYVNQVKVVGKTTHEIKALLTERFKEAKFLKDPHFNVTVVLFAPRTVRVTGLSGRGSVEVPFQINKSNTFLYAITTAGGVSPRGNPRDIVLYRYQPRMENGKPVMGTDGRPVMDRFTYHINWKRIESNLDDDFELAEDDYIVIKEDWI